MPTLQACRQRPRSCGRARWAPRCLMTHKTLNSQPVSRTQGTSSVSLGRSFGSWRTRGSRSSTTGRLSALGPTWRRSGLRRGMRPRPWELPVECQGTSSTAHPLREERPWSRSVNISPIKYLTSHSFWLVILSFELQLSPLFVGVSLPNNSLDASPIFSPKYRSIDSHRFCS